MGTSGPLIVAGTGHRPPYLGLGYDLASRVKLYRFARQQVEEFAERPTHIISGGAQGWDQALAAAAIVLKIPLTIAVPFEGQESQWPADAQERYRTMLRLADKVVVVSHGVYGKDKFILRDQWMVNHSSLLLALYDQANPKSGTGSTVRYAQGAGTPVHNCWNDWCNYRV